MADGVVKLTEGVIGSGKTCCCVRLLVDDFLPNKDGLFITNIPVYPDRVADYVSAKTEKSRDDILRRLVVIPEDIQEEWREGLAGNRTIETWLIGHDIEGAWILLDEAQFFFGNDKSKEWLGEFQKFASIIRHHGATLDLVTQAEQMIALEIRHLVAQSRVIIPSEGRRLPYIKIRMGDLYELWAKLGGRYEVVSAVQERIKVGRTWKNQGDPVMVYRSPQIFELYNSHGAAGGKLTGPMFEWQKRSWPSLLFWFWRRNGWHLGKGGVLLAVGMWFFFFGGLPFVMQNVVGAITQGLVVGGGSVKPAEPLEASAEIGPAKDVISELTREQLFEWARNEESNVIKARDEAVEARRRLSEVEAELKLAKDREERDAEIVATMGDSIMFSSGEIVRIGETVRHGHYKGYVLERIDAAGRTVHFADGRRLPLGRLPGRGDRR